MDPAGLSPTDRVAQTGYDSQLVKQNIGGGQTNPEWLVQDFMRNATTRDRLLTPELTEMGLGYAEMPNDGGDVQFGRYWTQVFAAPEAVSLDPEVIPAPVMPPVSPTVPMSPLIVGTDGDDVIRAGDDDDVIQAGAGRDSIFGRKGSDTLWGEADDDRVFGQRGDDTLKGGAGHDRLNGGLGSDRLYGDQGHDRLNGQKGDDYLTGGLGSDRLRGGQGRDWLLGAEAQVGVPGRHERDVLIGGQDADIFVLGDEFRTYYDDGQANTTGFEDYAWLKDFSLTQGDEIQLHGEAQDYSLGATPKGVAKGQGLFLKSAGADELIAVVQTDAALTLQSDAFTFV
ncbi:MAG: type I secretion protein [Cyanobacteria bacterium P01_H01_bin.162]